MNLKQLRNLSESVPPTDWRPGDKGSPSDLPFPINIPGLDPDWYHPNGSGGDWIDDYYWDGPNKPSIINDILQLLPWWTAPTPPPPPITPLPPGSIPAGPGGLGSYPDPDALR